MGNDRFHAAIMQSESTVRVLGSASMLFPWWSFTKCALAICALRLSEEGLINLEECRPGKPYTLRQLLQHRAGVPEYGKLHAYHEAVARHDVPWSRAKLLEEVQADQLDFEPGTSWSYSNVGYLFVRDAIEQAAGMDLGTALKQFITDPLELRSVRLAMTSSDFDCVHCGASEQYDPGWVYHGCLLGTAPDAARLLHALLHGRLLKPTTLQSMLETYPLGRPIPGRPWTDCGYGLGLMSGQVGKVGRAIGHSGAGPFCANAVYYFPDVAKPAVIASFTDASDEGVAEFEAVRLAYENS
jgi:CubicO group peptidase (beta-lactamase class C family)